MENEVQVLDEGININEIIYLIRIKWWIIAICFAVAVVGAAIYSFWIVDPVYSANALLFVGRESGENEGPMSIAQMQANERLVMDYREIIKSRSAAKDVVERLELDIRIESIQKRIDVQTVSNSRMFKLSFESTDPELAANIVNEMTQVIIIKAEEIVGVENVSIVDQADVPVDPIKPNKKTNVAVAGVLGLMLGVGIIFVIEFLDNTIKNADDVQKYLGLNIMGEIPTFEGEERGQGNNEKRNKVNLSPLARK
ncbi:MAG TPA: hypothetical protein DDZ89_14600 [Clostridiales bacterium]|nr:hypothetical protein [Clostridiales bacterium]